MRKVKNAPLEASNVAVLLEHIPVGATRAVHSLQVKRVEADHYSIAGGPTVDLVDAIAQIGSYSGKHSNPRVRDMVVIAPKAAPVPASALVAEIEALLKKSGFPASDTEDAQQVFEVLVDGDYFHRDENNRNLWTVGYRGVWASDLEEAVDRLHGHESFNRQGILRSNPSAKVFRFPEGTMTLDQWVDRHADRVEAVQQHWENLIDRRKFNRLDGAEQRAYEASLKKKAEKPTYRAWKGDTFYEIPESLYLKAPKKNPAAKFSRGKPAGGGHREERGYFYEVLNSAGTAVALTTNKEEAQMVCDNPKSLGLPKGSYTVRHVGGKGLIPATPVGRARKVK